MQKRPTAPDLVWRIFAVMGLIGCYTLILRPLRALFMQHIVAPVLANMPSGIGVVESENPRAVFVEGALGDAALVAPGGMYFLIPAVILVAIFPRRIYWLYLLLLNIALRFLQWIFQLIGVSTWQPAMHFADFMHVYLIHVVSLGLVVWFVSRSWPANTPAEVPSTSQ